MKDIFVLLVLLHTQTVKVSSQPYRIDSQGKCRDEAREYKVSGSNLCCKRCRPGQSLKLECSDTADSHCMDCIKGLYIETWNYNRNCFTCTKCRESKGLQYAQNCSSTTNAKCVCQPGMFCVMDFDDPYCNECTKYRRCKVGYGVSKPGSPNSDVRCERCPGGTFSDTDSSTDRCRPHTNCSGGAVVRQGDATSDTVCEHQTTTLTSTTVHTTASTTMSTVEASTVEASTVEASPATAAPHRLKGTTGHVTPSVSKEMLNLSTESPSVTTGPATELVRAIAGVFGVVAVLLIILILLCFCKRVWRRDSARLQPKVDANGNCQSGDKISPIYLGESQLTTFTVDSPEQQCMLENPTLPCSEHRQSITETSTGTDSHNSHESVGPSHSTFVLNRHPSCLSEPLTLLSDSEPVAPQPSVHSQSSSQPTSPQIISPITPGPHVNVNITLNIGNGSCGAQTCLLTGLKPEDCILPFGEKEECVNTPQQEGGKEALMPVHESDSYCT